jgi:hypothetical protein
VNDDPVVTFRMRESHARALMADLAQRHTSAHENEAESKLRAAYESMLATLRLPPVTDGGNRTQGAPDSQS